MVFVALCNHSHFGGLSDMLLTNHFSSGMVCSLHLPNTWFATCECSFSLVLDFATIFCEVPSSGKGLAFPGPASLLPHILKSCRLQRIIFPSSISLVMEATRKQITVSSIVFLCLSYFPVYMSPLQ